MVRAHSTLQIVLAAGRSERMGSPKPLLDFGGRTALELVVGAAVDAGVSPSLVVVGESGQAGLAVPAGKPLFSGVRWVENPQKGSEQLRSLQLALESVKDEAFEGFFIHPVDCPLATPNDYKLLRDAFEVDPDAHDVFILSYKRRRGHPIFCRSTLASQILSLGPEQTVRDVIETARIAHIPTPNAGVREDMDQPEDYLRLRKTFLGS